MRRSCASSVFSADQSTRREGAARASEWSGSVECFLAVSCEKRGQGGGEEAPAERLERHKRTGLVASCGLPCLLRLASTKNEHLGVGNKYKAQKKA